MASSSLTGGGRGPEKLSKLERRLDSQQAVSKLVFRGDSGVTRRILEWFLEGTVLGKDSHGVLRRDDADSQSIIFRVLARTQGLEQGPE